MELYRYQKDTCILQREHNLGIPLSLSRKKVRIADESVRHTLLEANHDPTCSKMVSPQSRGKYSEYTLKERVKMGMYAAENSRPGLLDTSLSFRLQGAVLHQN